MMDAQCQFPKDASEAALADHTYCISVPQTVLEKEEEEEIGSQYSQMDLFPGLGEDEVIVGERRRSYEGRRTNGGSHVTADSLQSIRVYPE